MAVVVLVAAFGLASWLLTGFALRPVTRLQRTAEQLVASGGDGLLPVGAARDEIHDLAVTLNRLIGELRATAARERQMVSDASHELRTPLSVLQTQLELMRTDDPGALAADVAAAKRATERLSRLSADLLELSRIESGNSPPAASSFADLVEEAGAAVDRTRLACSDKEIDIDFEVSGTTSPTLGIRANTFGRVVDNLLTNAATAVGSHGRIGVQLVAEDDELRLTVTDTGPGVPEDFLPHAFDRFARGDESRTTSGAGLGLAIVAAAVGSAGGRLALANRPEGGAMATVRLPL